MNIEKLHSRYLLCHGVCTDTRKVQQGDFFVALKGQSFDGNRFAAQALEQGAAYVLVSDPEVAVNDHYILVDDTLVALQQLAAFHRQYLGIPIVGITGTNGKTTTKELIAAVLKQQYRVVATQGNLNNHIGVPLTLLAMNAHTEIGVVEMGANHIGEIALLCGIAKPNLGLITNIGRAHLEGFGSFEGVVEAKSELYTFLKQNGGDILVNSTNQVLMDLLQGETVFAYSVNAQADLVGLPKPGTAFLTFDWHSKPNTNQGSVKTALIGQYNLENALAAIAVGLHFKVEAIKINRALEAYVPTNNRSQLLKTAKGNEVVLDAYNANPSSMSKALENFAALPSTKEKIVVLGDMLELGKYSKAEHLAIVEQAKQGAFAHIILVGKEFTSLGASGVQTYVNADVLKGVLQQQPISGASILVKGSRGIKLEQLAELL